MEHSPFSGQLVQQVLAEMDDDRDADGRLRLTPLVRIPQDGDEDFKWAVKQVLDLGGMGIILPHVDRQRRQSAWCERCGIRRFETRRIRTPR